MMTEYFTLTNKQLAPLLKAYPKQGNNSDIGKIAIEVTKLYFLSKDPKATFIKGKRNQPDIIVKTKRQSIAYEIKGTEDPEISFSKLKVSSIYCHNELLNGMEIIRVTNIRKHQVRLHFLKHGVDFTMTKEPRWAVKELK